MTGIGQRLHDAAGKLGADWEADLSKVREWTHHTSAAQAAAAVTINTRTPGGPVSLLDEIENDFHAVAVKFQAVDKAAAAKMEAIQANPGAMQLVDAALGYLHLPPAAFGAVVGVLAEVGKLYDPQQAASVPAEPQFTPAGPQVAGQA